MSRAGQTHSKVVVWCQISEVGVVATAWRGFVMV